MKKITKNFGKLIAEDKLYFKTLKTGIEEEKVISSVRSIGVFENSFTDKECVEIVVEDFSLIMPVDKCFSVINKDNETVSVYTKGLSCCVDEEQK